MHSDPDPDPDAATEAAFLRRLAEELGVDELSEEALFELLGFDELTDPKLDRWFASTMRKFLDETDGPPNRYTAGPLGQAMGVVVEPPPVVGTPLALAA